MSSPSTDPLDYIREWRSKFLKGGWWHSFELPDGSSIEGVSALASQKMRIAQFPIPADLTGKRVLDIGAWDGWFSFEMERRGAEVLAIDRFDNPRFREIHKLLGSRVEYRQLEVYDVNPATVGYFDIVLFMGVLYHLRHPLLALERVCSVTREMAAVESFILTPEHGISQAQDSVNLMQFFEDDDFGGQVDNWFAPTASCMHALCRSAGFARVDLSNRHPYGAAMTCWRTWADLPGMLPAPDLLAAINPDTHGVNFTSKKDEYVTCRISAPGVTLTRDSVFPQVDAYGVRPVFVGDVAGAGCLVHFKLPPGLTPGWHEVRLRTAGSQSSEPQPIAVDFVSHARQLTITGACDGVSWTSSRVSLSNGFLSLWVEGLPENADVANVRVDVGGQRQVVHFVGAQDARNVRQVNVLTQSCRPGTQDVVIAFADVHSPAVAIEFAP